MTKEIVAYLVVTRKNGCRTEMATLPGYVLEPGAELVSETPLVRAAAEPIRESLMVTCYECDNCKVFTPINREHCNGCGRVLNRQVEPAAEPDDDGCTGVDGTCPIHALHGAFVSNK